MKRYVLVFAVVMIAATTPAWGQVNNTRTKSSATPAPTPQLMAPPAVTAPAAPQPTISTTSDLKATPEMWFYEQYRQEYKDPKNAVRANAEFTAQQRANRLAAMRWFGFSNSRPRVGCDPVNVYPPAWSSNTPLQPNRWQGTGAQPYYVARPERIEYRSY